MRKHFDRSTAQLPKDWTHILNDSQCQTLFASTEDIYLRTKSEVLPSTPLKNDVICLDSPKDEPNSFEGMMENRRDECKAIEPSQDDLANLIYTSGTTGKPKVRKKLHTCFRGCIQAYVIYKLICSDAYKGGRTDP